MDQLVAALGLSMLGSVGGLLIASPLLFVRDEARMRLVPSLISYAVGTLLGVSLLAMVPEALRSTRPTIALATLLGGILAFFALEKLVLWRHCHTDDCVVHDSSAASLVLVGGALHNFADGAIIGAAVMTSIPLGVSAALAVAAHQIPQEVGDFAILLHAGYSRGRALALNLLSGVPALAGAMAMYFAANPVPAMLPFVLAFAAGSFLYVAMSDLIPDLHRGVIRADPVRQILLIAAGIGTVLAL